MTFIVQWLDILKVCLASEDGSVDVHNCILVVGYWFLHAWEYKIVNYVDEGQPKEAAFNCLNNYWCAISPAEPLEKRAASCWGVFSG